MAIKAHFKEVKSHFNSTSKKIIVQDDSTKEFDHLTYVIVVDDEKREELFNLQIKSEHNCSMFRGLIVWGKLVVIGFDTFSYVFNIESEKVVSKKLNSFFDSFFTHKDNVFICSMSHINCFDIDGNFLWRSEKLGVEGVKINYIEDGLIHGSSKGCDTGWKEFKILLNNTNNNTIEEKTFFGRLFGKKDKLLAS